MDKVALFGLLFYISFCLGNNDKIIKLPGLSDNINFNQYAGYVTVDQPNQRKLFYWFVESQNNPTTDPVVLWLNGGPGCSSLGGMMTELGPFRPNSDGTTLRLNPYSWNRVANVIFLESPAGVGFSKTNVQSDYTVGDVRTANDSYTFLQGFFSKYPQFRSNDFWVTGESYGGHYVPELANRILTGNKNEKEPKINLVGFMAGNPWTYMPIDNAGAVFYWWSHALISDETYTSIMKTCNFSDIGPLKKYNHLGSRSSDACDDLVNDAMNEMGNINIYDIYVDVCTQSRLKNTVQQMGNAGSIFHAAMAKKINPPYQPCEDEFTNTYLNLPDVQAAIHASIPYPWSDCSNLVNYDYSDVEKSVLPLYDEFLKTKLRILVYSGDVDAIVPYTGTRQWIAGLKRKVLNPWRQWIINDTKQVGGYVTEYEGLTFATVRNAGHMVPETQPERAFVMFSRFLSDRQL